jgi:tetratricopeptide (TPR) repeat protein
LYIRLWYHYIHYATGDAAAVADSLVKLYPEDCEGIVFRGQLYEMDKNLDAAIAAYQQAAGVDTSCALAAMYLGYAYSKAGEQEKAIAQMERYIRLAPDAADPRASYADLLLRVGRYDEALEQYRKSLELKQDYWYSFRQIGYVYETLGRLNDAQRQYERAFALLPSNSQLQASHMAADAELEVQRGKYEAAVQLYTKALGVDSRNGNAAFGLVRALTKLKKFGDAEKTISSIHEELQRRSLTRSEAMLSYHLMKANLCIERSRLDDALAQCDSAFDYSSPLSRAMVYRYIAEIHLREKSFEQALDACEDALRVNPNSPLALLTLVKVYNAQGDRRMTREIGGRLLRLWHHADPEFQYLAELKRILGMPA